MALKHSDALVVFGVTGDLAHKQIFPALYAMVKRGELTVPVDRRGVSEVEPGAAAAARYGQHSSVPAGSTTRAR